MKYKTISLNSLAFFLLCIFLMESVVLAGGRLFSIGPLSFRMLMACLLLVACLPFFIYNRKYFGNRYNLCIAGLYFLLVIGYCRAVAHSEAGYANSFAKGFFYFLLFPVLLYVIKTEKQVKTILKIILAGGTVLSLGNIFMGGLIILHPGLFWKIADWINDYRLGMIYANGNMVRCLFFGVMSQICACCYSLFFYIVEKKKNRYVLAAIINLLGIFMTYTRGVYLGAGCAAVFLFLKFKKAPTAIKRMVRQWFGKCVILLAVLALAATAVIGPGLILYGFQRLSLGTPLEKIFLRRNAVSSFDYADNMAGTDVRRKMTGLLHELIGKNIIFGSGAGAHIDYRDGTVEMVYHDIVSKLGLLGLLFFLEPARKMIAVPNSRKMDGWDFINTARICVLSSSIAVLVSSYTNPYVIGSLGIFIYCLAMRLYSSASFPIECNATRSLLK